MCNTSLEVVIHSLTPVSRPRPGIRGPGDRATLCGRPFISQVWGGKRHADYKQRGMGGLEFVDGQVVLQ